MGSKKGTKIAKLRDTRRTEIILQKCYIILQNYFKNISKIFQILLTFVSKCNIYNTKEKNKKMEELSWQ